jgi:flagellar basal-body rod protein FlgC
MDFMTALDVASSGMTAQRTHLNVISSNMANINTTRTAEGGPYRRKTVILESTPTRSPFDTAMREAMERELKGVKVSRVATDQRPFKTVHDPGHPDADAEGNVRLPDINVVEEMALMINAMRSYEAGAASVETVKRMFSKAVQIGTAV